MRTTNRSKALAFSAAALAAATVASVSAQAKDYFLASGRWDNIVSVIDLKKAIDPRNDATPNAIINKLRVTPDITVKGETVVSSGQPIIVTIAPDQKRAYISNHSGMTAPAKALEFQHGHPGLVVVLDLKKALDPALNGTLGAVEKFIDSEGFGATGFAVIPNSGYGALAHAEQKGNEDGGRHINFVDLKRGKVAFRLKQAYGDPGFECPTDPVPHKAPDPNFGCFPDTNGVTASPIGGGLIFTANGGTDDVSVISVERALRGLAKPEVGRVPMQAGGFGVSTSPDGTLVAHASRESAQTGVEGNTVSLIDVKKARKNPAKAEVARILVGTNDASVGTRPFVAAFTPDGKRLVTTQFRSNNVDIVDVSKALKGKKATLKRITLETPDGGPSVPRGVAITADGRYAAITGAVKTGPGSSVVWILDLETYEVKGRVTQVGNESYMIGAFQGD